MQRYWVLLEQYQRGNTSAFAKCFRRDFFDSVASYAWNVTKNGLPFATSTTSSYAFNPTDNGTYLVSLSVTDNSSAASTPVQATIAVTNVAPVITGLQGWVSQISERSALPLTVQVSDPGADDTFIYNWIVTRNALPYSSVSQSSPNFWFQPSDDGLYEIRVEVRDDDMPSGSEVATTRTVTVNNVAPTATVSLPSTAILEGSSFSFGLVSPADSTADQLAGFSYAFDLNGDGDFEVTGVAQSTQLVSAPSSGPRNLQVKITDKDGSASVYPVVVDVQNVPTAVTSLNVPTSAFQGAPVKISGTFTDPGAEVFVGNATIQRVGDLESTTIPITIFPNNTFEFTQSFGKVGTYSITVVVNDTELGQPVTMTRSIQIDNVAPTLDIGIAQSSVKAGRPFSRSVGFVDPGTDTWQVIVDYDTSDNVPGSSATFDPVTHTVQLQNTYLAAGNYNVGITVNDGLSSGSGSLTVNVSPNVLPNVQRTLPSFTVNQGYSQTSTFANLREYFDDLDGSAEELLFSISGNSNNALVQPRFQDANLGFSFDASLAGTSLVTVRATDVAGDFVEQTMSVVVRSRDVTSPNSTVNTLPSRATSLAIPISVTGNDPAGPANSQVSGVREYDLYVAEGSGAFTKFATVPASNPNTTFQAQSNKTYFFRSVARDNVGNVESKPVASEAQIIVGDFDSPVTQVTSAVANSSGLYSVQMSGTDSGGGALQYLDLYVSIDDGTAELVATSTAGAPNASGVYQASANYQARVDGVAHKYRFFSVGRDSAGNIEQAPGLLSDVVTTATFNSSGLAATGIDVQLGAQQRSYIRFVDILFNSETGINELLLLNPIKVERFALDATNVTPETGTAVTGFTANKVGDHVRLDWGVNGITGSRTSNAGDGFYRVLIDGNGDGDFVDAVDKFFEFGRILGDANGDYSVTVADRDIVDAQLGRTGSNLNGDVDGSGAVNSTDRTRVNNQIALNRAMSNSLKSLVDD
ncbi:MAG: hypothetical protein U0930_11140 [Pirellulales bacterium]